MLQWSAVHFVAIALLFLVDLSWMMETFEHGGKRPPLPGTLVTALAWPLLTPLSRLWDLLPGFAVFAVPLNSVIWGYAIAALTTGRQASLESVFD